MNGGNELPPPPRPSPPPSTVDPGSELDQKAPFQRSAYSYISVVRSELEAQLTLGGESSLQRGSDQVITLDPIKYSVDPDYPDVKVRMCPVLPIY